MSVSRVYLHVDLGALDASEACANQYAAPGGPSLDRLLAAISRVSEILPVVAAALTAYDTRFDVDGRAASAAQRILREIARGLRRRQES